MMNLLILGIVVDGDLRVPVYTTDVKLGYNFITYGLPMNIYLNVKNIFNYNYVELIGNLRQIRNYSFGLNLSYLIISLFPSLAFLILNLKFKSG